MTQREVSVSPLADEDVLRIVDYFSFEVRDDELANRFVLALNDAYTRLLEFPNIGSPRWQWRSPKLGDVRVWRVPDFESYLIFYRPRENGIDVVRVLHGARDLDSIHLEES